MDRARTKEKRNLDSDYQLVVGSTDTGAWLTGLITKKYTYNEFSAEYKNMIQIRFYKIVIF